MFQPTVIIGGNTVSPVWDPSSPVVLAGVVHEWGRQGLYDPNEPGKLTVEIIDPDGSFVGSPSIFQSPISMRINTVPPPTNPPRVNLAWDPAATKLSTTATIAGKLGWVSRGGTVNRTTTLLTGLTGPAGGLSTAFRITYTAVVAANDSGFDNSAYPNPYPVTVGKTYTASAWVRTNRAGVNQQLRVFQMPAPSTAGAYVYGTAVVSVANTWQRVSVTWTATMPYVLPITSPTTTAGFNWANGDTLDGTGLLVEESATVGDYFDGATADVPGTALANGIDYAWTGSANASSSVATEFAGGVDTGVFAGWIDTAEIRPHAYTRPDGAQGLGWIGRFTATDVLAALAKTVTPGFEQVGATEPLKSYYAGKMGVGYWQAGSINYRIGQINQAIARVGLGSMVGVDTLTVPALSYLPIQSADDDLYTLIVAAYARDAIFPADVRYNPETKRIYPGKLAAGGGLILAYVASSIVVQATTASGAGAPLNVPAGTVGIDADAAVLATFSHNVTSIRLHDYPKAGTSDSIVYNGTTYTVGPPPQDSPKDFPVSGAVGFNQYEPATKLDTAPVSGDPVESAAQFAARLIGIVQLMNDRLIPPEIRFELNRFPYAAAVVRELLVGRPSDAAWTFPGAIYEGVPGWGPFFQLIGGTSTYDNGWTVAARFAPARSTGGAALAINQLVTVPAPLLNQYDPAITLNTLGIVTGGI